MNVISDFNALELLLCSGFLRLEVKRKRVLVTAAKRPVKRTIPIKFLPSTRFVIGAIASRSRGSNPFVNSARKGEFLGRNRLRGFRFSFGLVRVGQSSGRD